METKRKIVFISSTLRDLREYRSAVRSLAEPLGLEFLQNDMMDASPDKPLTAMHKMIDRCDIFIGIYARYYGRIPEGQQVSYIENEYEYAKSADKPQFCFILEKDRQWPSEWTEDDPNLRKQLYRFIDKITKERLVAFFTTPDDLARKVYAAIKRFLDETVNEKPTESDGITPSDMGQYQATAETVNVRVGPGPSYSIVGELKKGDIVDGIATSDDGKWIQITRSDGLTGWCSGEFLVEVDNVSPSPTPIAPEYIEQDKIPKTDSDRPSGPVLRYIEQDKTPRTDSDHPSGPDRLNYTKYAQAFAKIILNHETSTPLTIGIYGQWGQGKSFLMGKIKDALKDSRVKREHFSLPAFWKKYKPGAILENFYSILDKITFEKFDGRMREVSKRISRWNHGLILIIKRPRIILRQYRRWINNRNKKRRETVEFHIIEFNAWAYVGTDHLWAGLVTQLYKEAEKYFGLRLQIARLGRAIKKSLPKSILIFAFYAFLGAGLTLLLQFNETKSNWDALKITVNAFAGSFLAGSAIASLPTFLTALKDFVDNLVMTRSKNLQNLAAKPDFRAQIGLMADIKEEISFIGKLLRKGKDGHPTRFVLFIDDLDRCEHKKAVEVMQAIMLLLADEDGAPFVIFMGIDARVIVRAIEATYEDVLVKAGINGYEYLDKIVQLPFVIPRPLPEEIRSYVDSLVWTEEEKKLIEEEKRLVLEEEKKREAKVEATSQAEAKEIPSAATPEAAKSVPPKEEKVAALIAIGVSLTEPERTTIMECSNDLTNNPRKIKRIINIYRFARLILPPEREQDRKRAIHWFLMTEQWPLHLSWIIEHIKNDEQTRNNKLVNKKITDVFKLVKKNIHSGPMENLLSIDADPDIFENYIKSNNFTVQEITKLLPYTFNLNPAVSSEVTKQMLKPSETKPKPKPKRKKPANQKKQVSMAKSV